MGLYKNRTGEEVLIKAKTLIFPNSSKDGEIQYQYFNMVVMMEYRMTKLK